MPSICCLMPVSSTASEWALRNYSIAMKLASGKNQIRWFAACNTGSSGIPGFEMFYNPPSSSFDFHHNCVEHAACLHYAIERLKLQKYSYDILVIIDSDMFLLYPNWDEELISIMRQHELFGADYVPWPVHDQYQKFPSLNLFVARCPVFFSKKIDIYPTVGPEKQGLARTIVNPEEAMLVGLPMGARCSMDTSWRLPLTFRRDEHSIFSMPVVRGNTQNAIIKSGPHDMARGTGFQEFYWKNKLFSAHFQGCRGTAIQSPQALEWLNQLISYLQTINCII